MYLAKKTMLPNKNAWGKKPLALGSSEHFFIGIDHPETGWPIPRRSLKKLLPEFGYHFEILSPNCNYDEFPDLIQISQGP